MSGELPVVVAIVGIVVFTIAFAASMFLFASWRD
jgi:hypothetical protein